MTSTPDAATRVALAHMPHRTSSYSSGTGSCVEIASTHGWVSIRDSKEPIEVRSALMVPQASFADLLAAVQTGRLH